MRQKWQNRIVAFVRQVAQSPELRRADADALWFARFATRKDQLQVSNHSTVKPGPSRVNRVNPRSLASNLAKEILSRHHSRARLNFRAACHVCCPKRKKMQNRKVGQQRTSLLVRVGPRKTYRKNNAVLFWKSCRHFQLMQMQDCDGCGSPEWTLETNGGQGHEALQTAGVVDNVCDRMSVNVSASKMWVFLQKALSLTWHYALALVLSLDFWNQPLLVKLEKQPGNWKQTTSSIRWSLNLNKELRAKCHRYLQEVSLFLCSLLFGTFCKSVITVLQQSVQLVRHVIQ